MKRNKAALTAIRALKSMKYFIVHTPSYSGGYEGKTAVIASTAVKAVENYCVYIGLLGKAPKRFYAVEITKEEFEAFPNDKKLYWGDRK